MEPALSCAAVWYLQGGCEEADMAAIAFDTLSCFEKLKAAGVPEEQARVQEDALREWVETSLVTRRDLKELE